MAAVVTFTVQDCVHCARNRVRLRKRASTLKLFLPFRPLKSVAINIIEPLPKCRRGFQFIIMIADRCTELVQVALLRRIRSVNVAQACLEHWIYKYGPPKSLLLDNGK